MSGIITILAVKGHPEFFRTGNIDKSLKSRRIQRRGFHDKVHGNCEKWNKFQLVGFENHSLFSNGSISILLMIKAEVETSETNSFWYPDMDAEEI